MLVSSLYVILQPVGRISEDREDPPYFFLLPVCMLELISYMSITCILSKTSIYRMSQECQAVSQTYDRDLTSSEGPLALVHSSHAFHNPLAADYTEGMSGPSGLLASSPGHPPYAKKCCILLLRVFKQHVAVSTKILLCGREQIFLIFLNPHEAVPAVTLKIKIANFTSTQRSNSIMSLRQILFSCCSNQDKLADQPYFMLTSSV